MEIVLTIYGIGIIVAAILIVLLAQYYIKYSLEKGVNIKINETIIISFLSWFIAIPMLIIYKDNYKKLFTELFKPVDKNEEEEI